MRKSCLLLTFLYIQFCCYGKVADKLWLDKSSLCFHENKGQIIDQHGKVRSDIQYSMETADMAVFVGNGQLHYQFYRYHYRNVDPAPLKQFKMSRKNIPVFRDITTYRLDVELTGANPYADVIVEQEIGGSSHYYTNGTGEKGVTDVRSFKKITYKNIYPGIDWTLYTNGKELKYDFIVHETGKVTDIKLKYKGTSSLKLMEDGSIKAETPYGSITEQAPFVYTQADNKAVASRFILEGQMVSFATGAYSGSLIIDPGVVWATYFGGGSEAISSNPTCDRAGNVYMSGSTSSIHNIATSGSFLDTLTKASPDAVLNGYEFATNAFLVKFDSNGVCQWSTYYGGSDAILSAGAACDTNGNVYMAGHTNNKTGIATSGSYQNTLSDASTGPYGIVYALTDMDGFLVKFNNAGIRQWGTYYGGYEGNDEVRGIASDKYNGIYLYGQTYSSTSIATSGSYQDTFGPTGLGGAIAFMAKFNDDGLLQWGTYYGDENYTSINDLVCDEHHNFYIIGSTNPNLVIPASETSFATPGAYQTTSVSFSEGFLAKFNDEGFREWGTYFHGSTPDEMYLSGVACDRQDHVYITGSTKGMTGLATSNSYLSTGISSNSNSFLAQFDSSGVRNWCTYFCEAYPSLISKVACAVDGTVYMTGRTTTSKRDFPGLVATPGSHQEENLGTDPSSEVGFNNTYLVQFDSLGERRWGAYYGGSGDKGNFSGVICDRFGSTYLAGITSSRNNVATQGSYQDTLIDADSMRSGYSNIFLVRFTPVDLALSTVVNPADDSFCTGQVPISLLINNQGRRNEHNSVLINCTYSGAGIGTLNATYTQAINAGSSATVSLGNADLSAPGTYEFIAYLTYTKDDSSGINDTIKFTLVAFDHPAVAGINVDVVNTDYVFMPDDAQRANFYHWDFGDGMSSTDTNAVHSYANSGNYMVTLIVSNPCGSDTVTSTVQAIGTGIENLNDAGSVFIYPNPASEALFIGAKTGTLLKGYSIQNILGQRIREGIPQGRLAIDVSDLTNGTYFLKINTNKGYYYLQFKVIH